MANRWLVFNVGCIECGVDSNVVGVYPSREEADKIADILEKNLKWRGGGQNEFLVFDLLKPQADEYFKCISTEEQG
jgi:hypothetical protein